jgi:hypothetical protein
MESDITPIQQLFNTTRTRRTYSWKNLLKKN